MGKIVEKKRKKKGRPSLLDIQKRTLREQQQNLRQTNPNSSILNSNPNLHHSSDSNHRFTHQNPQLDEITDSPDRILAGDDEFFKDANQTDKKYKFVLRVPSKNQNSPSSLNSQVSTNNDGEDSENLLKKRKINAVEARSGIENGEKQEKHNFATTDSLSGTAMESGSSTPLPDKKLLVFILDRLQKKDTYGVYSEPVDPKELPDYHEIVEHPMDFGTVREKLASGVYANLEEFEKDVFLICSNAMKYNAPDTIYFRQARSIQELARKDFENLRQDSDDNESRPKIERRGRPPTKNLKKRLGRPPLNRTASEFSSEASLANSGDNHGSHNGEAYTWSADNDEFSGSMLKGVSVRIGKNHIILDENRRNTYKQYHPMASRHSQSVLSTFDGEKKQLLAVGLHTEHGFARSLARFAASLGPIAWKIASRKIERSLPSGTKFGPGWVGESESPLPQNKLDVKVEQEASNNSASMARLSRTSSPSCSFGNISHEPSTEHGEIGGGPKSAGLGSIPDANCPSTAPIHSDNSMVESEENSESSQESLEKQKLDSDPPDLNIRFKSPGSSSSALQVSS